MIYLELIVGFLKVGLFSFGGAYGAISLIRDVVLDYGWLSEDSVMNMIAVSESTPGSIMVNLATYVGSSQGGFLGALLATIAVVVPAFIIILTAMVILDSFLDNKYVQAVLFGLKPCIMGIILATGISMLTKNALLPVVQETMQLKPLIVAVILSLIYFGSRKFMKKKISPIMLIVISAIVGMVAFGI
ncbi:MAG: chromate transporter [Pseudobutyrivibrio sp.]|nr:chromate transporter [Pseudobutyrivibrio sp.]